jgi:hypothetical protein
MDVVPFSEVVTNFGPENQAADFFGYGRLDRRSDRQRADKVRLPQKTATKKPLLSRQRRIIDLLGRSGSGKSL